MARAMGLTLLGCIGTVVSLSMAFGQVNTGPCTLATPGNCFCSFEGDEWYYCKDYQWWESFCQNMSGPCSFNSARKCYADNETVKVVCSDSACAISCTDSEEICKLNGPDCDHAP